MSPSLNGRLTPWILALVLAWPAFAADPGLTPAGSFAADGIIARERKIPILVLYSRDDCRWCEMVKRSYLIPLAKDRANENRVLIREVDMDTDFPTPLTDFGGRTTTHGAFARTKRVKLTPTLDFLDDRGNRLVEPIVGMRLPDFYGTLIERAIDEALARMRGEKP